MGRRTRVWIMLAVDGNKCAVDVGVIKGLLAGGNVVGFDRGASAAPARVVEDHHRLRIHAVSEPCKIRGAVGGGDGK